MPRSLPPIAPRFPSANNGPPLPTENHNVALRDAPVDPMERVRALQRAPSRYITEPNPFTLALWATLNEPAGDVIARHAATMRYAVEAHNGPQGNGEPGERQIVASVDAPAVTAIQAVTDAVVSRAMQGDQQAADMVAKRIEGSVGQRRGDIDPEAEAQRASVRRTIEQIVRDMSDRAIAVDVTAVDHD